LLEKSRIISQRGVERNFHIFYQVLKAFNQEAELMMPLQAKFLKKYDLDEMESYHYVN
jgi:myosin heavy subunit